MIESKIFLTPKYEPNGTLYYKNEVQKALVKAFCLGYFSKNKENLDTETTKGGHWVPIDPFFIPQKVQRFDMQENIKGIIGVYPQELLVF